MKQEYHYRYLRKFYIYLNPFLILQTADTLQIKGLGEKYSESVSSFIGSTQGNTSNVAAGGRSVFESSSSSSKLLSVPSHQSGESRQLSTESLPEYLHR